MASKSKFGLGGIKTTMARTKQQASYKFSGAKKTTDVQFEQEKARLDKEEKALKGVHSKCKKFLDSFKSALLAHAGMADEVEKLYEADAQLYALAVKHQQVVADLDAARVQMERHLEEYFVNPVKIQMGQYNTLHKRCEERSRRAIDLDRHEKEASHLRQKPPKDPSKLQKAEEKYQASRDAYDMLNNELLHDIPKLVDDRYAMFDPIHANLIFAICEFYARGGPLVCEMRPYIANVNREVILNRPQVITEDSCANYLPHQRGAHAPPPQAGQKPPPRGAAPAGYGAPQGQGYGAPQGQQQGYGAPQGQQQGYGAPQGQQQGYGAPQGGYGAPPQQQQGGYGAPPQQQGGYGAPQGGYGGPPPQQQGGYGAPPPQQQGGYGAPPPVVRKPQPGPPQGQRVRALYPFHAEDSTELSFNYGDIITVTKENGEWFEGELNGNKGMFPANYVEKI